MTAAKKTSQAAAEGELPGREAAEMELARQLAGRAQAEGLSLTGPGGLPGRLTKVVLEGALEGEMDATWDTRSMTRPGAMAGTPATGTGPRRC